jgi:hypothetical protein
MIEVLRVKIMWLVFIDTFDVLVSSERTIGEDILLAQERLFLDLVLIHDPSKESWDTEYSIKSKKSFFYYK